MPGQLKLAVALDAAGWHPAAWREPNATPDALFTAGYWSDLVLEAERGLLDFVTVEDALDSRATFLAMTATAPGGSGAGSTPCSSPPGWHR